MTQTLAQKLAENLMQRGWRLTLAESCTGGMIAAACTDLAGSSAWFDCGFVTYSNTSKHHTLHVREESLTQHGAVSECVVKEMALGALNNSRADITLSVSGIAGPEGGSSEKPVGTVWFAVAKKTGDTVSDKKVFSGDRAQVRTQAVAHALHLLILNSNKT